MASVFEGRYSYFEGINTFSNPSFEAFDVFAKTPSTEAVILMRNTNAFIGVTFDER